MAKGSVKHPKITPLRAFELLRDLDQKHGSIGRGDPSYAVDRTRDALASHVRNALVKVRA
jgi:hypothetical protein